jgi:hypothetical protein
MLRCLMRQRQSNHWESNHTGGGGGGRWCRGSVADRHDDGTGGPHACPGGCPGPQSRGSRTAGDIPAIHPASTQRDLEAGPQGSPERDPHAQWSGPAHGAVPFPPPPRDSALPGGGELLWAWWDVWGLWRGGMGEGCWEGGYQKQSEGSVSEGYFEGRL